MVEIRLLGEFNGFMVTKAGGDEALWSDSGGYGSAVRWVGGGGGGCRGLVVSWWKLGLDCCGLGLRKWCLDWA